MTATVQPSTEAMQYLVVIQALVYQATGQILSNRETFDLICAQHVQLVEEMTTKPQPHGKAAQTTGHKRRPDDNNQQQRRRDVCTFANHETIIWVKPDVRRLQEEAAA